MDKYIYGIIFWNKETDDEICAWFEADNWHAASDIARSYQLSSYVKGPVHYLFDSMEEAHPEFNQVYTVELADLKLAIGSIRKLYRNENNYEKIS